MTTYPTRTHPFTRMEYDHLIETADPSVPFGWRHGSVDVFGAGSSVAPLAEPAARLRVADLLP